MPVKVAAISFRPSGTSSGLDSVQRAEQYGEQVAAAERPDVMVFGELLNVIGAPGTYDQKAEAIPGPSTGVMAALARAYSTYVVFGMLERSGSILYNTAVLLDRSGSIVGQAVKVLEDVENPFPPDFYQDKSGAAFQTQMYFLLSRFKQQQEVVQQELFQSVVVADYIFQKDRIFAYLTLGDDELALYDKLYATLEPSVPVPDLVLYLTADVDTCLARIRKRARGFEREISEDYMSELIDAYNHYFHYYNRSPLLVVDTRNLNLVGRGNDFDALVDQLKREIRGTEYFATATKG